MEDLLNEGFVANAAAEVHHAHVKEIVSVAEISKVNEVILAAGHDEIAELKVSVDGGIGVGGIGNELPYGVLLGRCKIGRFSSRSL